MTTDSITVNVAQAKQEQDNVYPKMKVVQLQYKASASGDFAKRLHDEFVNAGIESSILTLHSDVPQSAERRSLGRKPKMISSVDNHVQNYLLRKVDKKRGLFSYPMLGTNVAKLEQVREADIIYLHWVLFGFLGLKDIEALAKLGKPIVFILHDMWTMTGGCHYSFDCEKYKTGCSKCPMFPASQAFDLAASGFRRKKKLYDKYDNLYFASPSKWLYECAKASALTGNKPVFHIPNVLDIVKFKPFDKKVAKQILNIGTDEKVIAFGAVSVDSPYKGWRFLRDALQILHQRRPNENISVVVFGGGDKATMEKSISFKSRFVGRISDEHAMAVLYNAADIFIAPSLADNLPYVIFEALACGTPVVAFNTGGIPDMVQHEYNGYLARYKDAEDLAKGIEYCLDNDIQAKLPPELDNDKTISKHRALFESAKSK